MTPAKTLEQLRAEQPEWGPWLAMLAEARAAAASPPWRACRIEPAPDRGPRTPLLDGATLTVDAGAAAHLVRRLLALACRAPGATERARGGAGQRRRAAADVDALAFIESGLASDVERAAALARGLGMSDAVIAAVGHLAAVPAAHACARAHPEMAVTWTAPYCPVCGGWPTLAEERGLERSRRYRCAPCGTDWWAAWLTCPYCGEAEHDQLAALVVDGDETRRVDACHHCRGYLKTLTLLTAAPDVAVLDASTVELDVAAGAGGFTRPAAPAHRVRPRVVARPGLARRLLGWGR